MRRTTALWGGLALGTALAACKGKDGDDSGGSLEPAITGTIQPERSDAPGNVRFYKAFGFDQGGKMLGYLSSSPDATCDNVTQHLRSSGEPADPTDMFAPETCNLFILVSQDYDGGVQWSRSEGDSTLDYLGAGSSVQCALGRGRFELRSISDDHSTELDYYYTGRTWQGRLQAYSFDFSGGGGSGYTLGLSLSQLDGNYIYEDLTGAPATADVSGSIEAEWCPGLASTGLF